MDSDGLLNLKAELFTKTFGFAELPSAQAVGDQPSFAPREGSEAYAVIDRGRREGSRDPRDLIGLGTLVDAQGRGGRLGVFVQRPNLRHHPIVERALTVGGPRAEVVYTGPVRRHGGAAPVLSRPLEIGSSVGHARVTAGTLGCFAIRRADGEIGILSNNHVLAATNAAAIGDVILQPGRVDGGVPGDSAHHVAELSDMVRLDFGVGAVNKVDAAFARLLPGVSCVFDRVGPHAPSPSGWTIGPIAPLALAGLGVKKLGRTTRLTHGIIAAIDLTNILVTYEFGTGLGAARFDGLMSISGRDGPFSKPGDSGSVIFSDHNHPLALLTAGTKTGGHRGMGLTYGSPIDAVLRALDIDIHCGP